jgi:hypothetical protein
MCPWVEAGWWWMEEGCGPCEHAAKQATKRGHELSLTQGNRALCDGAAALLSLHVRTP